MFHPSILLLLCTLPLAAASYTVRKGDTLYGIAQKSNISIDTLCRMNRIDVKHYTLKRGMRLAIPDAAKKTSPPKAVVSKPASVPAGSGLFLWPYRGSVVRGYGLSENVMNTGIDIRGNFGDPVMSARAGVVEYVGTMRGYGTVVILKHENDYNSIYAHLSESAVKKGDAVAGNAVIGKLGMSGFTDAPELHFKICVKGKPKNPLTILPKG
ncbi:MAG: LysM peptidoglycan-binding domain-containing M23 family metallopeptidase [Spirochaetota bacterium]